ncbi:bile acid:sodium symporter family protein [Natronolimnohabitans innermongolicus]|uniref:Bile acid:sodium symporter n=1 Tax=Natronolimnohabitans innermongolicus JCM 12255 TaxID=1227499 RepID=L9WJA9_9EURY|nr:bile acid:sodium symporter [Natronolimnohabitans innermongolicus]ELY49519.1 hypothetical protein C493_20244 [Natronolimnohabitans innermongolicus JCM 12255]
MNRLRNTLQSQQSLLVVIVATIAGVAVPGFAAPLEPLIPVLVAGLIFTAFYGFSVGELSSRRLSRPVLASLVCLYLLVPLALYPVAAVVLSGELLLGVLVVLSAPLAAGSSIIWTRLGGGNTLLATVTVLASMVLAPVVMPSLIAVFAESTVELSVGSLVAELAAIIAIGGVLAYFVPNGTVTERQLDGFSVATLGALIYVGVGGSPLSVDPVDLAFVGLLAVAALCLSAGLSYGCYARGMRSDDCVTVLFSSSMKNMSVSVMVGAVVGGGAVIAAITAFHVVQQLVSSSLVHRLAEATAQSRSQAVPAQTPEPGPGPGTGHAQSETTTAGQFGD